MRGLRVSGSELRAAVAPPAGPPTELAETPVTVPSNAPSVTTPDHSPTIAKADAQTALIPVEMPHAGAALRRAGGEFGGPSGAATAAYSILTPAQAMSRFQHMLERVTTGTDSAASHFDPGKTVQDLGHAFPGSLRSDLPKPVLTQAALSDLTLSDLTLSDLTLPDPTLRDPVPNGPAPSARGLPEGSTPAPTVNTAAPPATVSGSVSAIGSLSRTPNLPTPVASKAATGPVPDAVLVAHQKPTPNVTELSASDRPAPSRRFDAPQEAKAHGEADSAETDPKSRPESAAQPVQADLGSSEVDAMLQPQHGAVAGRHPAPLLASGLATTALSQPVRGVEASHGLAVAESDRANRAPAKSFSASVARSVSDSGHSRAELILEPAELGRLRFDLVTQGDRVQINLSAERPETLSLMRNHAEDLRQEFRDAGFADGTLNFSQWSQQGEGKPLPDSNGKEATADDLIAVPLATTPPPRPRTAGDGLDLRL
ncbi:MAG: flagellar hook-length control protein FliK [Cypionkella sp.]